MSASLKKIAMKKILLAVLFAPLAALAQPYPSPTFNSITLQNPLAVSNGGTGAAAASGTALDNLTGFSGTGYIKRTGAGAYSFALPIPVADGGTNCASASGTCLDNLSGFSGTGFVSRTGAGAYSFTGSTGSGNVVLATSPALTSPTLTTPNIGAATGTSLSLTTPLSVANGGVGAATLPQYNVLLGNGTGAVAGASPGASGNLLSSNGASANPSFQTPTALGLLYDNVVVNVKAPAYGALGNSNGTHGNGNDDTAALQSAWNAGAGGTVFLPCGTYRLTSTITVTDNQPRKIHGQGACTKIFNDSTVAVPTLSFSPSTGACSVAPCVDISGLSFTTPFSPGGAQSAIQLTNESASIIRNNQFFGQNASVVPIASYAPKILQNQFIGGVTGVFSVDTSMNGGEIGSNGFYGMSGDAIYIVPASQCATGVAIRSNDMEQNAADIVLGGVCGGVITQNYVENLNSSQAMLLFTGTQNSSIKFEGNLFNGASSTITVQDITNAQFIDNYFSNVTMAYGTAAAQIRMRKSENTLYNSTLPATSVACTGYGTGGSCIVTGDDYSGLMSITTGSTGTAATGAITLTFTNAIGPNAGSCAFTPVAGTANWSSPSFLVTSLTASSVQVTWTNGASLTASKVYQLGYTCQGY